MEYGEPNLNEGKPWSEMDLVYTKYSFPCGRSVAEIVEFRCRCEREAHEKIAELKVSASHR